jgi:hypothetical protein
MSLADDIVCLGPYHIEGGMRFVAEKVDVQDAIQRDLTVYINGFCRSCQIHRALDLDIPIQGLRFWHQRIGAVQIVIKDLGPLHEVNAVIEVTFEADEDDKLIHLDDKMASEMARAAVYSFLSSYETFYG